MCTGSLGRSNKHSGPPNPESSSPHFSTDRYTYGAAMGLPNLPNLLAGGGYEAADFPTGSGNASWQLDVN